MKKLKAITDPKSADIVVKLRERLERDEKRFKNLRCVYLYRNLIDNIYTDNVIMLDYATRSAHKKFLEVNLSNLIIDFIKRNGKDSIIKDPSIYPFHMVNIHFVGVFDKAKLKFSPNKSVKTIIDCDEVLRTVMEVEK